MGGEKDQCERHCSWVCGDGQYDGAAGGPYAQPTDFGADSGWEMGRAWGYWRGGGVFVLVGERLCAWACFGGGWGLVGEMKGRAISERLAQHAAPLQGDRRDWRSKMRHYKRIGEIGTACCATTKRTGQDKLNGSGDTDYADC